jgi:hypothetical protein
VGYEVYLTAVNARAKDEDAQVEVVNGIRPDEFAEPTWFAITEGKNLLEVIVTAEDHLTTNTYLVEIDRQVGLGTSQAALLKAFNGESGDRFGVSIAIDGDTLAVGARGEDSNGITGEADNSAPDAGAVYVFERVGNIWLQQAYLKASNAQADDSFGSSVGLFGDLLVVGAPGEDSVDPANEADNTAEIAGAAYVFARSDGIWTQQAYLKASNREAGDKFGYPVAISGSTVAIGACGEDSNSTMDESNNDAEHAGAVYVFSLEGDSWVQQEYLKASNAESYDYFGCQITLNGDTLVVSAIEEDASALGGEGDNSETDSGAVYVFYRNLDGWSQQSYLKALDAKDGDHFGISTALSADTLAIAAPGKDCRDECYETDAGAVYIFRRDGDVWQQHSVLSAFNLGRNDNFGSDIRITGNVLVVGAYGEDASATDGPADNSMAYAGAAYIFVHDGEAWKPVDYLKASNADGGDAFGRKVALAGDTLIIAADGEDSAATAGENDNSESESGAVYVYAVGNR